MREADPEVEAEVCVRREATVEVAVEEERCLDDEEDGIDLDVAFDDDTDDDEGMIGVVMEVVSVVGISVIILLAEREELNLFPTGNIEVIVLVAEVVLVIEVEDEGLVVVVGDEVLVAGEEVLVFDRHVGEVELGCEVEYAGTLLKFFNANAF